MFTIQYSNHMLKNNKLTNDKHVLSSLSTFSYCSYYGRWAMAVALFGPAAFLLLATAAPNRLATAAALTAALGVARFRCRPAPSRTAPRRPTPSHIARLRAAPEPHSRTAPSRSAPRRAQPAPRHA